MLPVLRETPASAATPVNRLSSLFNRLFDGLDSPAVSWSPMPFSAWEDEDKVHVEVDVPGMTEKDIEVTFHQGQVVIRGERRSPDRSSGYDSRLYGRFEQRLALPQGVQADQAEARLAHGVLCLSFPKAEEARPKRIALKQQ